MIYECKRKKNISKQLQPRVETIGDCDFDVTFFNHKSMN